MKKAQYLREQKRMSLEDVALRTGIKASRISRFETEPGRLMSYPALKILAEFYQVTIDALLETVEPDPQTAKVS